MMGLEHKNSCKTNFKPNLSPGSVAAGWAELNIQLQCPAVPRAGYSTAQCPVNLDSANKFYLLTIYHYTITLL